MENLFVLIKHMKVKAYFSKRITVTEFPVTLESTDTPVSKYTQD